MPKKIALLIGVSECGIRLPPHLEAVNNVAAMQRVLPDPKLGDFEEVESLLNPDLETIQKAIQTVFASCGVNDLALLFFSGHGIIDEDGHLYFTTSITAQDDFQSTAVPASFIQQQLSISDAARQIVILDCCYIGAFAEGWQTESVKVDINQELGARGRIILTSSTTTQMVFEQETTSLSPYTQYLVEGIETGAADRDGAGLIYVRELHNYAKEKVQDIQPYMEPNVILDEKDFDIVLTVLPNQDPNADPEAEYLKIEAKYRKIVEKYGRVGEIPEIVNYTLDKKQKTFGLTVDKDAPDDLASERDIDYTKLRDLLKAGQWKEADHETLVVIL
ncbi:MAG TPA: caspase family protein, partial [Oculatellaceae cyanobacterium]